MIDNTTPTNQGEHENKMKRMFLLTLLIIVIVIAGYFLLKGQKAIIPTSDQIDQNADGSKSDPVKTELLSDLEASSSTENEQTAILKNLKEGDTSEYKNLQTLKGLRAR